MDVTPTIVHRDARRHGCGPTAQPKRVAAHTVAVTARCAAVGVLANASADAACACAAAVIVRAGGGWCRTRLRVSSSGRRHSRACHSRRRGHAGVGARKDGVAGELAIGAAQATTTTSVATSTILATTTTAAAAATTATVCTSTTAATNGAYTTRAVCAVRARPHTGGAYEPCAAQNTQCL